VHLLKGYIHSSKLVINRFLEAKRNDTFNRRIIDEMTRKLPLEDSQSFEEEHEE
jgi:hypothetical protein